MCIHSCKHVSLGNTYVLLATFIVTSFCSCYETIDKRRPESQQSDKFSNQNCEHIHGILYLDKIK